MYKTRKMAPFEIFFGGRKAQWITFSLHTQWPRVQFLTLPRFIEHCLVIGIRTDPSSTKQGSANPVGAYTKLVLQKRWPLMRFSVQFNIMILQLSRCRDDAEASNTTFFVTTRRTSHATIAQTLTN